MELALEVPAIAPAIDGVDDAKAKDGVHALKGRGRVQYPTPGKWRSVAKSTNAETAAEEISTGDNPPSTFPPHRS